jgi:REP element-mobilizing transposase RayT
MPDNGSRNWHSRGYLPHFDGAEVTQSISFRLADSLPRHVLEYWQRELNNLKLPELKYRIELQKRIEFYLDRGTGASYLQKPEIADIVESAFLYFDGERYQLRSWVIMPNHVHLLLTPRAEHSLTEIIRSLKSYTAHKANKLLGRTGKFWSEDYFDRYIRDGNHYAAVVCYIENNPVKSGLCHSPEQWRYSSAWWNNKER